MRFFNVLSPLGNRKTKRLNPGPQTGDPARFRASGTWAEHDMSGHAKVMDTHGIEAARKFGIPR